LVIGGLFVGRLTKLSDRVELYMAEEPARRRAA